ncbi:MAG: hypothetical protein RIC85_05300 [Gammaproteobacteria bacterium]
MGHMSTTQSVPETPIFTRQTEKLFTEDEKRELIDFLAERPLAGVEIPGTVGARKVRFAASGRGKKGRGSSTTTQMTLNDSIDLGERRAALERQMLSNLSLEQIAPRRPTHHSPEDMRAARNVLLPSPALLPDPLVRARSTSHP